MDDLAETLDPRREIVRLEARIETLRETIENCRKFRIAARVALVFGAVLLAAIMVGRVAFDALTFSAAVAALLGGAVLLGSNRSTANEAEAEIAAAESRRASLIGSIDLRVIDGGRKTLH